MGGEDWRCCGRVREGHALRHGDALLPPTTSPQSATKSPFGNALTEMVMLCGMIKPCPPQGTVYKPFGENHPRSPFEGSLDLKF